MQHQQVDGNSNSDKLEKLEHNESADLDEIAKRGHVATDQSGHALVHIDPQEERALRRKIDFYVLPPVALLFWLAFIDRANIGNANIAGFQQGLHLRGYDYNIINSCFYISYILCEIPSNIACKHFGPGKWIPFVTVCFGICSLCTAFVTNRAQACVVRFLLGIFEAGMMPGIAYYLSRWYRKSEFVFRIAYYLVAAPLAGAIGGLLASGILKLNHIGYLHTWRMLFFVEGMMTTGVGILAYFLMTDRPATARWLNEHEKALALARIKVENVGATEVLDHMDAKKLLKGMFNPTVFTVGMIFLFDNVTVNGLAFFLPKIISTIFPHHSVIRQQLYTVPPYIVGAVISFSIPYLSYKTNRRGVFCIIGSILMMTGYIMFLATNNSTVRYVATFVVAAGAFNFAALSNAWAGINTLSDTTRAVAIATNVSLGAIGGLVSTWSFLPFDSPAYHIGNGLNLATSTGILILSTGLLYWQISDNKRRDKRDVATELSGLTQKQIQDLDWKHPAFRWLY